MLTNALLLAVALTPAAPQPAVQAAQEAAPRVERGQRVPPPLVAVSAPASVEPFAVCVAFETLSSVGTTADRAAPRFRVSQRILNTFPTREAAHAAAEAVLASGFYVSTTSQGDEELVPASRIVRVLIDQLVDMSAQPDCDEVG